MSLKKLGRYDLTRVLGKGAMGLVYEGRDPNLNRRVAIKTIKVDNLSDEAANEYEVRFRTEAHSAARLQHPNIVSVYDSDRDGDIAFLVLEFVEGDDLKHHLDKGGVYTLAQTLGIMQDLLSALAYAHKQKIVHRDIKPANLLVQANGRIKLADFGVARIQDSGDATRTQGSIVGTLKYMSPEQLEGRPIDARADLFAAGVVLYQLLTGKRPFDGDTDFAVIQNIVGLTPPAATFHNPGLPRAMDAVVAKALAKSRDQRFTSAEEFADALMLASKDAADATVAPVGLAPVRGATATWTATMLASESLMATNSGIGTAGTSAGTSIVAQEVELVYWKDVKDSGDANELQQFLYKFPSGIYADLARRRLRQMGVVPTTDSQSQSDADSSMDKTVVSPRGDVSGVGGDGAAVGVSLGAGVSGAVNGNVAAVAKRGAVTAQAVSATRETSSAARQITAATRETTSSTGKTATSGDRTTTKRASKSAPAAGSSPRASLSRASPAAAKGSRARWPLIGLAVVAIVAAAGIGLKMKSASTSAQADAAAATAALAAASAASAPAAATAAASTAFSPLGLGPGETAVVVKGADSGSDALAGLAAAPPTSAAATSTASTPVGAASAPASAAAKAALSPASAAQRQAAFAARQAASAAAKKALSDKEKSANPEVPAIAAAASSAASKPKTAPATVTSASGGPRSACEDRVMLGFQICMTEQCAKPAFAQHPSCIERRQMDERRRETERNR